VGVGVQVVVELLVAGLAGVIPVVAGIGGIEDQPRPLALVGQGRAQARDVVVLAVVLFVDVVGVLLRHADGRLPRRLGKSRDGKGQGQNGQDEKSHDLVHSYSNLCFVTGATGCLPG
jgi:hypothetical protein